MLLVIFVIVIIIFVLWYLYTYQYEFVEITNSNKKQYHRQIQKFENKLAHWYPLGQNDKFKISHGNNYYSFFERLGKMNMLICLYKGKVIGIGCGVLRNINHKKVWYICDLKIDEKHRGKWIPFKMLLDSFHKIDQSNKIYGISMNNEKENKVLRLARRIPLLDFKKGPLLYIYSLDYEKMLKAKPIIQKHRRQFGLATLSGVKDLIIQSTEKPMPLLHLDWNKSNDTILDGYTYMFCCPEKDPMKIELDQNDIMTDITATIVYYNMNNFDWRFVMTSEI
ncbi:hypothetical protein Klosneuvirus_5_32 [Klosneuvirus KNV1]|uniref:N-acetyltransferase domain-containing protein n=1 Tax=Klosneuvirus KNV1 TaxID=1977640 RepID=A0A1V0SKW8_9VIRU|nr:hypothetical protein Klosneuvirus_5_32 [Klosneuvirus KNV1]